MRASRLLTIQMLLQARGRMSARALAQALEVSVRTLHRDIDQLSAAGVPVYAERGRDGGFALRDGWKTTLTGLTADEAQAVFMAGLTGPAAELGLGAPAQDAQLKLLAALPSAQRQSVQEFQDRFHLDPIDWYREAAPTPHLQTVAQAVWSGRQLRVHYQSWRAASVQTLHPLGLVLKAGVWYVVALPLAAPSRTKAGKALAAPEPRTYRVAGIESAQMLDAAARRPKGFDLAAHWRESLARFERSLYAQTATVRATPAGVQALVSLSAAVARAVRTQLERAAPQGELILRIPIENSAHGARLLLPLAPDVVATGPRALCEALGALIQQAACCYASVSTE